MIKTVYHINYLKYLDRARNEALNQMGVGFNTLFQQNMGIFVFELQSRFIKPAFYDQKLHVYTRVPKIEAGVITIEHVICNQQQPDLNQPFQKFENIIHQGGAKAIIIGEGQKMLTVVPEFIRNALL
jgi:YbgC/YbaW family acyl-CoA thioester hydrolase